MKEQLRVLKRLGATDELIESFKEVCEINAALPTEMRSDFSTLLEEQCRRFGFHEILPDGWFFRPYTLGESFSRSDTAVRGEEPEAPAIEQAYRRGVSQGFAECRRLFDQGVKQVEIRSAEKTIDQWRRRTIQCFGSRPGNKEKPPKKLFGGRSSISLRLRWTVLERDKFKCVTCGATALGGAVLEVDHKTAVSNGGFDTLDNLQTLCFDCNRGKSTQ